MIDTNKCFLLIVTRTIIDAAGEAEWPVCYR